MWLFCVTTEGSGVELMMENGEPSDVGFVHNAFVLALSEEAARRRAIKQVHKRLKQKEDAGGLTLNDVVIKVDKVSHSKNFWNLVRQQGFLFYPGDEVPAEKDQHLTASLSLW